MARPSYFQKVLTRTLDPAPIRPASGLLARWAQVADAGLTYAPGPAPLPRPDAATPAPESGATLPRPAPPRHEPATASDAPAPAAGRTPPGPRPGRQQAGPRGEQRSRQLRQEDDTSPPPLSSRPPVAPIRHQPATAMPTSLATLPFAVRQESHQSAATHTGAREAAGPAPGHQHIAPPALREMQRSLPAAATAVGAERVERPVVMPARVRAAAPVPPHAAKPGATVQIGTIEVNIIREASASAPASPAPRPQAIPPLAAATPATHSPAPISRPIRGGHGFHQS